MFAMCSGRLPRPAGADADPLAAVAWAVRAQLEAGLDLVTDGGVRWADPWAAVAAALEAGETGADGMLVRAWREAAEVAAEQAGDATPVPVAAVVPGPWSLAARVGEPGRAMALAALLGGELVALAEAGCVLAVVEEPAATGLVDDAARDGFRDAQLRLLGGEPPLHAMLSVTGGSAWEAGAETIGAAPYRSYLLDLIAGPDNWSLARALPGDRGIVCAALRAPSREDQAPVLVWAANYAASMDGRGLERVGLANASPLGAVSVEEASSALAALARAAAYAAMSPEDAIAAGLDRRTFAQPAGRGAHRMGL